ncbi:fumarylacetoacetate hydrolase [Alphaproteobacteria bacterium 46_93_T64]|nr:fumarylacetoacetate hydrolase [Alphaproteobacteria bacterium 46_93_T64]
MDTNLTSENILETILPKDADEAILIGRVWIENGANSGPRVVRVCTDGVYDLTDLEPTCSELMKLENVASLVREFGKNKRIEDTQTILANTFSNTSHRFLSPIDLQAVKACGVTFAKSMLERVIEERAGGDPQKAMEIRASLSDTIGQDIGQIKPGSNTANKLKVALQEKGYWSQYLEVGIGPDAEVFTKAPVLSSVGIGADVGIHPGSSWNNPEPEAIVIVNSDGTIVGATLGNDVNLRDFEGRSALLLGKAKDNNASAAIGPFIRLFDEKFTLADLEQEVINLSVKGEDGFELNDFSSMSEISRSPSDLVSQTINRNHQYPDGIALYMGTMFAPTKDRGEPGSGFTHAPGDQVTISSDRLGALVNKVTYSNKAAEWKFGIFDLYRNLAERGLLTGKG